MADKNDEISGQGGAVAGGTTDDKEKTNFIEQLKSEVFPTLPREKVVDLVEELRASHVVYSESDLLFVKWIDMELKSIGGAQLARFRKYVQKVQGQQDWQLPEPSGELQAMAALIYGSGDVNIEGGKVAVAAQKMDSQQKGQAKAALVIGKGDVKIKNAKANIGSANIDDKQKTKFLAMLQEHVLPNAPAEMVVDLVEELGEHHGVFAPTDLAKINLKTLKLKSIKGVQLDEYLKYAQKTKENLFQLPTSEKTADGSIKAAYTSREPPAAVAETDDEDKAASAICDSLNPNEVEKLTEKIKENLTRPVSAAKVIGMEGGAVRLPGSGVEFSSNAFDEDTTVLVSAKSGNGDTPQGLKAISATLKCSTSGTKFRGLATVQLATYYNVSAEDIVVLCKKNRESQWQKIQVPVSSRGKYVTFQVSHFCQYKIFLLLKSLLCRAPKILLYTFLFYNKKTASICALTCLRDPAVKEECIRALSEDGYSHRAIPLPDSIVLKESEGMSYSLKCEDPDECRILPEEEVHYYTSTFTDSKFEIRNFRFEPVPEARTVHIRYTLCRPKEQCKVSSLSLELVQNDHSPAIEPVVNDATAPITNVLVRGSTQVRYTAHLRDDDTIYQIEQHRRKGKVLIINNDFLGTRRGSEVDVRNMKELWRALGFTIENRPNLSAQEMSGSCRRFASESGDVSAIIVIIMTHGGREIDGTEYFKGEDRRKISVREIINIFTASESPHLRGKPKVFIFQSCIGRQQDVHVDDANEEPLFYPRQSDMLVSFATQSGFTAKLHRTEGSWFINAISNVFMQHAHDTHVMDMFTKVNNAVASKITENNCIQISNQDSYMRRNLFLFPGWPN